MGFRGIKAAFFLDIAGKMQSLSLLHLIEKFAEIHRQVSLCSLTAVGLGIPTCFFRIEPVSIAECFAFCSETSFFTEENDGAADPGNSHSRASAPCDFRFPSR